MYISDEARQAEDMTAFCHPRGDRVGETDRARRSLRFSRRQNLQDIVPIERQVCIDSLAGIVTAWLYDEAIVGMDVPVCY